MKKDKLIEMMKGRAINAKTEVEAKVLLDYLYALGFEWRAKVRGRRPTYWELFKNSTIYFVENDITFGDLEVGNFVEVITFEEFKKLANKMYEMKRKENSKNAKR